MLLLFDDIFEVISNP